jgi:hypothetical protein
MESLIAIKRAGADAILTYFAKTAARLLKSWTIWRAFDRKINLPLETWTFSLIIGPCEHVIEHFSLTDSSFTTLNTQIA